MIRDLNTQFDGTVDATGAITASAVTATRISTNVVDLRQAATPLLVDEGISGPELWLIVQVIQAFNNLTSLAITLESDSAVGLATTPVVHYSSGAILLAALVAGFTAVRVQLPSADYQRYVGLRYTVVGTAPTTGTVQAFLTPDIARNKIYPGNFIVG